jgi:hypothetical protein
MSPNNSGNGKRHKALAKITQLSWDGAAVNRKLIPPSKLTDKVTAKFTSAARS